MWTLRRILLKELIRLTKLSLETLIGRGAGRQRAG